MSIAKLSSVVNYNPTSKIFTEGKQHLVLDEVSEGFCSGFILKDQNGVSHKIKCLSDALTAIGCKFDDDELAVSNKLNVIA